MITSQAIEQQRDHFSGNISKVRINSNVVVTDFELEKGTGYFVITFEVPEGITQVSKLELLSSTDVALVSTQFYVEVVPNTFFKHRVNIKGE